MQIFSERQARVGALLGNGVLNVTKKVPLTKPQWLILGVSVIGAVVVGSVITHTSHVQPAPGSLAVTDVTSRAAGVDATGRAPVTRRDDDIGSVASTLASAASVRTAGMPAASDGRSDATSRDGALLLVDSQARAMALIDGLAKDTAKINQKLDDLAGRQKLTSNRLAALIADVNIERARLSTILQFQQKFDEKASKRSQGASESRDKETATPHVLVVNRSVPLESKKRVTQKPTASPKRIDNGARALLQRRRAEIASRVRALRRRQVASRR